MNDLEGEKKTGNLKSFFFYAFIFFLGLGIFLGGLYSFLLRPPIDFPKNKIFEIKKGESFVQISKRLKKDNFIHSEYLLRLIARKEKKEKIVAGKYLFDNRTSLKKILEKISQGESIREFKRFTILEGEANYIIARKISKLMKNINEDAFLEKARKYEGMLFPDTYNLNLDFNEDDAIEFFVKNFETKIKKNNLDINKNQLIIASLVEAEAGRANFEDKRHVAGVIYNRLKKNMPLQLDYVFFYMQKIDRQKISPKAIERIIWKGKKIDSPFNNYKYIGLPPNPVSNPSLDSLKAVVNYLDTKDLYYITGKDGKFYYAKTGSGHYRNIRRYLK